MLHQSILTRDHATLNLAELIGAFSYALDLTEGQPAGHSARACYIGSRLGQELGLPSQMRHELFYTLLLKDLGCSSNAARIWELYRTDDRRFKHDYKIIPNGLRATLGFVFSQSAREAPMAKRAAVIGHILRNGGEIAQEMILSRCTRGSDIARKLRFPEPVCAGIYSLDEHWDGSGRPGKLRGDSIPLHSRIALLAQIADVFHSLGGPQAALDEVAARAGSWLDPELAAAFLTIARDAYFWRVLSVPGIDRHLPLLAPEDHVLPVDEDFLDDITNAFGEVIDAKSPYTSGHSGRVAAYTEQMASKLDLVPTRRRWLRRAAALHDVGKLGVPNSILDKPGRLDEKEWKIMRNHSRQTQAILGRIKVLSDLAPMAAAHHERLDGTGYPLGLQDRMIAHETRIITVCDYYDALTADRPYRSAMPRDKALDIMRSDVGAAIDPACFETLCEMTR